MPLEKSYSLVSWKLGGTCGSTIYMYAQLDLLDKQPLFLIVKTPAAWAIAVVLADIWSLFVGKISHHACNNEQEVSPFPEE